MMASSLPFLLVEFFFFPIFHSISDLEQSIY